MLDNSFQIILSYRIEGDPTNNNAHSNAVYRSFENIAVDMHGKHDQTTSTYLFWLDDYQQLDNLLERIKQEYDEISSNDDKFYEDEIRAYYVSPDGEFIINRLKIKDGFTSYWTTIEFCAYFISL